jgi:hypothetical protein
MAPWLSELDAERVTSGKIPHLPDQIKRLHARI